MMPPTYGKAYRWVGEMEEIARFYEGMAADHAGPQQATAALTDFLKRS